LHGGVLTLTEEGQAQVVGSLVFLAVDDADKPPIAFAAGGSFALRLCGFRLASGVTLCV